MVTLPEMEMLLVSRLIEDIDKEGKVYIDQWVESILKMLTLQLIIILSRSGGKE